MAAATAARAKHTQPSACQTITQPPLPMQKMLFVFTISLLNIQ